VSSTRNNSTWSGSRRIQIPSGAAPCWTGGLDQHQADLTDEDDETDEDDGTGNSSKATEKQGFGNRDSVSTTDGDSEREPGDISDQSFEELRSESSTDGYSERESRDDSEQDSPQSGFGLIWLIVGAGIVYAARPISDFSEKMDAIGSTTSWDEAEAAEWNVWLTRICGAVLGLYGLFVVVSSLL
jgi:hypothetical protein